MKNEELKSIHFPLPRSLGVFVKFCILHSAFCILFFSASAQRFDYKDRNEGDTVIVKGKSYIIHKTKKDETIFTIAAKYQVSVNDLDNANKDVINNLKKNTILLIPVDIKVAEAEQEEPEKIDPKDVIYNIALIVSINQDKNYSVDSTLVSGFVLNPELEKETNNSLEFYEGVLTALDSLKMAGLKAKVYVVDAYDSATVNAALNKSEVKDADLLITNINQSLAGLLSNYSVSGKPVIVSCATNASVTLRRNSSVFYTSPSSVMQCFRMGEEYISSDKANDHVLIIKTALTREVERAEAFKQGLGAEIKDSSITMIDATRLKSIADRMVKGKNNVVFLPSTDESFVSDVINVLKASQSKYTITLIGLPTWQYFQSVSAEDLHALHTQIFSSLYVAYQSPDVKAFRQKFNDKYFTEPSEYAFSGYDAMLFFGEEVLTHGLSFVASMNEKFYKGLSTNFSFVKHADAEGFENRYISVLQFEDYSLKKVNK